MRPPSGRAGSLGRGELASSGTLPTTGSWRSDSEASLGRPGQLTSITAYAGTLLHELTHVRSGTTDVTRDFEDALTATTGTVAGKALEAT